MSENILTEIYPVNDYRYYLQHNDVDMKYGLPEKKKYPMPDRDHVMSAIKFFNYVSPSDENELARNILARIREYGMTNISVGENNRFGKYYKQENYLAHHGILGMKWGVRRYQNSDGSLTEAGKKHYSKNKVNLEDDWDNKVKEIGEDAAYNWLMKKIESESGDLYNAEPVSDGFRNVLEQSDKELKKFHRTHGYDKEFDAMSKYEEERFIALTEKYWERNDKVAGGYELKKQYQTGKGGEEADRAIEKAFNKIEKDPEYKKLRASYREAQDRYTNELRKIESKYENMLEAVVLDDLGYKDTKKARELIRPVIFWD